MGTTISRSRLACLALLFALSLTLARAQKKEAALLQADKGRFSLLLEGKSIGHEEFEIAPSGAGWTARGTTSLKTEKGADTKVTGSLTLNPDGSPVAYEWTSQAEKSSGAHVRFANGIAKITLEMQGSRPFEQDLTFGAQRIAVLDNNLYHQYAVLARLYDWAKGGTQQLPVLIPQELTPGSVALESSGSRTVEGKGYEGLRVTTSDLEILLLLDAKHKLMRIEVPSAKVSVVREP